MKKFIFPVEFIFTCALITVSAGVTSPAQASTTSDAAAALAAQSKPSVANPNGNKFANANQYVYNEDANPIPGPLNNGGNPPPPPPIGVTPTLQVQLSLTGNTSPAYDDYMGLNGKTKTGYVITATWSGASGSAPSSIPTLAINLGSGSQTPAFSSVQYTDASGNATTRVLATNAVFTASAPLSGILAASQWGTVAPFSKTLTVTPNSITAGGATASAPSPISISTTATPLYVTIGTAPFISGVGTIPTNASTGVVNGTFNIDATHLANGTTIPAGVSSLAVSFATVTGGIPGTPSATPPSGLTKTVSPLNADGLLVALTPVP